MKSENRKLTIGIVCYPTFGGSGVVACELAHGLAKRGHEVHVVSYAKPARLDTLLKGIHFHQVRVPAYPLFEYPPYSLALATRLTEVISEHDLDILHVHYALPHAISGLLAKQITGKLDLPLITTLHGTDITIVGNDPSYLTVTRYSLESSDRVTGVSKWLGQQVKNQFDCNCRIEVIYNFVDTEIYSPIFDQDKKKEIANSTPILMHISNFRPVKRIDDVVETFLKVRRKMAVKLIMVGDGPDREAAERKISESGYEDDVKFLGMQYHAEKILPYADLLLFPSASESFGLAALEAMSCGVPVIGANAGGLPEVVENEVSGRLLDLGNTNEMAEACLNLLSAPKKLKKMKSAARKRAIENFSLSEAIDEYENLYNGLI